MKVKYGMIGAMAALLVSCSGGNSAKKEKGELDGSPVVAHRVNVDGQDLTVCELSLLKDSVRLPLSYLAEDLQIVKLERGDEALVGNGGVYLSDNYMVISRSNNIPCKLFGKDGKFIGNIGAIGQGPGEYTMIYDIQIDEASQRVYLLPWNADQILVYNLKGEYEKSIPLNKKYEKLRVPKGVFKVDSKKNQIAVCLLPFDFLDVVAWVQDMDGNFIHEIPAGHFKVRPDFSNEMLANRSTEQLDLNISTFFELRKDTLYHYDTENNKMLPQFTIDFGGKDIPMHTYFELPRHFMGIVSASKEVAEGTVESVDEKAFIVDKETLKCSYYQVYNDYLGDIPLGIYIGWACRDGYYAANLEPAAFTEQLEKVLKENTAMDNDMRKKLETLKASIDEDDNNYILFAKLRR